MPTHQDGVENRDKVYYTCCKVYFVSSLIFNSLLRNYVLSLPYKNHFLRKSRITRHSSQNRFFNYFAKTSLLLTKLRKNILGFKRFILKSKLWKVGKIDFMPVFRTKHGSTQLREKGALVRNIPWYWNKVLNFYNRQVLRGHVCDVGNARKWRPT